MHKKSVICHVMCVHEIVDNFPSLFDNNVGVLFEQFHNVVRKQPTERKTKILDDGLKRRGINQVPSEKEEEG